MDELQLVGGRRRSELVSRHTETEQCGRFVSPLVMESLSYHNNHVPFLCAKVRIS